MGFLPASVTARLLIAGAFAVCFILIGVGVHKTISDREIAQINRKHAEERAEAAEKLADAEQNSRKREAALLHSISVKDREYAEALKQRDYIIRDQHVTGSGLRSALARARADAAAAAAAAPTCGHVSKRVETLAVLLEERDGMAEESERTADDLRDELALCRGYADTVKPKE